MINTSLSNSELTGLLAKNILFADVSIALLAIIAESLQFQFIKQNNFVYQQGEESLGLYLVVHGEVQIINTRDNAKIALSHSNAGHLFGEFLLSGNSVRSASAYAISDCELLFWPIDKFIDLLAENRADFELVTTRLVRRLFWNQTMQVLRLCELFMGLDESIVRRLVNQMVIKSVPADTLLFRQNDPADEMCIVIHGQFQISKTNEEHQTQVLSVIGRGETVGEIGLISGTIRNTDVKALRDSTVAYLKRDAYESILQQNPLEINRTIVKSIVSHLNKDTQFKPVSAETFALILLSPHVDLPALLQRLVRGLRIYGLTTVLSSREVDQAFMHENAAQCDFTAPDNEGLLQWLSEQEAIHKHIIYCTDAELSNWTQRCLRQADHVLFIADANDSPHIKTFEAQILKEISDKSVKKSLLLLHADTVPNPTTTSLWLKPRQLDWHYHVKNNQQNYFDRLARFLTGNALGLVLGGGAARGFAHIGVLKALKQLHIAVDLVGGNSMGAILAAEYALQWDEQQMLEKTRQLCLQRDRLTLPIVSLFSGKIMTHSLRSIVGDLQIEDLWIPFFCVSCNISRAKLMTHHQGTLLSALLSSNAPPGLFPPQVSNGDLLVDGALLNNLPVDTMLQFNRGGSVIAVDVNEREDLLNNTDNLGEMSGLKLLWSRLNPFTPPITMPNMVQILTRSSMIGGLAQQKKMRDGLADLYLKPPVTHFSLMDYAEAEKIAEAGYRYASVELEAWLEHKSTQLPH